MNQKYKIVILGATTVIIFILFLKAINTDKVYQPNQMVNKKIPEIILEDFNNKNSKIDQNIFSQKDFVLINIWASWCVPCLIEHPFLMSLKNKNKIDIIGINYKDENTNAQNFLKKYGNPYSRIGVDKKGEVTIQLGAYGVPETYVLKKGLIIFKHIGPINEDIVNKILELKK
ncbi:MAG: DsbE family thiol:disulfide interchange protein [Pelagibacterales bacterium]|nr:DsbE family thiol:disulfide interchange protein [Pelagibacterales bacterium]